MEKDKHTEEEMFDSILNKKSTSIKFGLGGILILACPFVIKHLLGGTGYLLVDSLLIFILGGIGGILIILSFVIRYWKR